MIRSRIAFKIGASIVGLMLVVLLSLYLSLEQLIAHVAQFRDLGQAALSRVEQMLVLAAFGAIMLTAGLAVFLSYRLAQPLLTMRRATREISRGQYHVRVPVAGNDEVSQLGQAINDLAQHLDHLDKTRKQFLADVAHELRTPLTYIKGYSEVVYERLTKSPDEERRYVGLIYEESQRVERLIQDLFTLAQADEGDLLLIRREPLQIDAWMQSLVDRVSARASAKEITVSLSMPQTVALVEADPLRLEQALINVLDNAVRYTMPGGKVSVEVVQKGDFLYFQVSDSGMGIPRKELPYIWNRLYRVEKSRSRVRGGSGLGLAIVKQVIEAHGGFVSAQSEEGAGTVITLGIPLRSHETTRGERT
ncbi:sensor histidine kinase [Ferroacidibacillus organovorans]|uniref:histidine kinase n=1 Tax=Ferroacidibacillus organovorans TaxID=1765683 RepID=A0A101XTI1_9BACL|nr:HAMP domain-containing sensor histidine kinase [Ferroacidibacillus organovorans]KUO97230.1 hypothetical protein ATW55_11585 [Ferroacidibacillus organovorans]